jgi:hypothetical protein
VHVSIATDADLDAVAALVNSGFRGDSSRAGWTTEADFLGGQRTDPALLRAELAAAPEAVLLLLRDAPGGELLASVWLDPEEADVWHLGMLTVRPDLQARQLGRTPARRGRVVRRGARRTPDAADGDQRARDAERVVPAARVRPHRRDETVPLRRRAVRSSSAGRPALRGVREALDEIR